ncbi:MAG: CAP domain-containing protein [Actinomycetota bacterium]
MRRAPDPSRPRNHQRFRRQIGVLALLALALVGPLTSRETAPAAANADEEAAFVDALNEVRAAVGLPPFTVNGQLADLARDHAQEMADAGEIFHASPISEGYVGPWSKIGENVGVGAAVDVLVDAFVASPGHYANIIDPAFTEIGVGVVWRDNAMYTTHRFLQLPGAPVTTAPPVPSTTAPARPTTSVVPSTSSTVPALPPSTSGEPPAAPLAAPPIEAARVLALLDLLDQVGT